MATSIVVGILLAGCGARSRDCTPGRSVDCACPGGGTGAQTCLDNGTYGPCDCGGDGDADVDVDVDADDDADVDTDVDSDVDSDTDSGGDSDGDVDSDTDADTDWDSDSGSDGPHYEEDEPNDSCADPQRLADDAVWIAGSLMEPGDLIDSFQFSVAAATDLALQTNDITGDDCGSKGAGTDTVLTLYDSRCHVLATNDDDPGRAGTHCSRLDVPDLARGSYVVNVGAHRVCDGAGCTDFTGTEVPNYELEISR